MCALSILRSKGQGYSALITENGFQCITAYPLNLLSVMKLHTNSLRVKNVPYRFMGLKVKVTVHLITKYAFQKQNDFP